uniref:SUI1 domain-containing protein n=1 Tax=Macrostomum lignano TaxID=282301 RepID=A0A1I8FFB9_9PLAT
MEGRSWRDSLYFTVGINFPALAVEACVWPGRSGRLAAVWDVSCPGIRTGLRLLKSRQQFCLLVLQHSPTMPGLFHKPFRVKSHAKLKSTERRQLLDELRRCYPDAFAISGGDEAEIRTCSVATGSANLFKSKIVAHTDQTGFVYFAARPANTASAHCLRLVRGLRLCLMARALTPLPACCRCWQNGADLMAPGLVAPMPDSLARGAPCCLRLAGQFVAVGRAAATAAELAKSGGRGRAVLVDHVCGCAETRVSAPTTADAAVAAAAVEEEAEVKVAQLSEEMGAASVDSSCNKPNEQFDEDPARRCGGARELQPSLTSLIRLRIGCRAAAGACQLRRPAGEGPLTIEDVLFVHGQQRGLFNMGRPPGEVTLDALLSRLASPVRPRPVLGLAALRCWTVTAPSCWNGAAPLARVSMRVESRASNKCVSLLAGLPDFGVDAAQFAKRVQRALSVSAGVQSAPTGGRLRRGGVGARRPAGLPVPVLLTEDYQISKKYTGRDSKSDSARTYEDLTFERQRMEVFVRNLLYIRQHNALAKSGQKDLHPGRGSVCRHDPSEFLARMTGLRGTDTFGRGRISYISPAVEQALPDTVDWRKKGAVTPVKNQGQCGSCWSFSTTGSLEGQHFRKTGRLLSLSEQQLVDCAGGRYGNQGCNGGLMNNAFMYIRDHGIELESDYPYQAAESRCQYQRSRVAANCTGFVDIPQGSEDKLKEAWPTSARSRLPSTPRIRAFSTTRAVCTTSQPAAVSSWTTASSLLATRHPERQRLLAGEEQLESDMWGEKGYIRMSRNKNNQCGIASTASYPTV